MFMAQVQDNSCVNFSVRHMYKPTIMPVSMFMAHVQAYRYASFYAYQLWHIQANHYASVYAYNTRTSQPLCQFLCLQHMYKPTTMPVSMLMTHVQTNHYASVYTYGTCTSQPPCQFLCLWYRYRPTTMPISTTTGESTGASCSPLRRMQRSSAKRWDHVPLWTLHLSDWCFSFQTFL